MLGYLQKKTGQSRQELDKFLTQASQNGQTVLERGRRFADHTAEEAKQYAQQAGAAIQQGAAAVEEQWQQGVSEARQMVRSRPMESLSTAFGAGLITGVIASLLLSSRRA